MMLFFQKNRSLNQKRQKCLFPGVAKKSTIAGRVKSQEYSLGVRICAVRFAKQSAARLLVIYQHVKRMSERAVVLRI